MASAKKLFGLLILVAAANAAAAFAPDPSSRSKQTTSTSTNSYLDSLGSMPDSRTRTRAPVDPRFSQMSIPDQQGTSIIPSSGNTPTIVQPLDSRNSNNMNQYGVIDEPRTKSASIWDTVTPVKVQGGSLRTWAFSSPRIKRTQVFLKTEGRPLNAIVELWQGPDNTPQKMGVYLEDGDMRTFQCSMECPGGGNTVAVRNQAQLEFPLTAGVMEAPEPPDMDIPGEIIQGGALKTYSFSPTVGSVQVILNTQGRPLNARLELIQGPNNNKQVVELYTDNGLVRPFVCLVETPGSGNVIRILNSAPMEYPLIARLDPYVDEEYADLDVPDVVVSDQRRF